MSSIHAVREVLLDVDMYVVHVLFRNWRICAELAVDLRHRVVAVDLRLRRDSLQQPVAEILLAAAC